jgi:glyoxylase-like metal-dependent hydrolase (beta-lactamase superfamily II)
MAVSEPKRLELPTPFRIGSVNAYLLEGSPLTLVDTGPRWPASLEALDAALAHHGHALEQIELVILTHQHCDHFGLADVIRRRSGARVAAIAPLAVYVEDYERTVAAEDDFAVDVMRRYGVESARIDAIYAISRSFWRHAEPVEVDVRLADGETIVAGGRALRVAVRPGHSPTDTLFVDESAAVGFTGDHLLPRVSSNPVVHRPLGGGGVERRDRTLALYLDSLGRTAELGLRTILPGHGPPHAAPNELIASRVGHHEERKEAIAGLIAKGRRTVSELADALWGDVHETQIYLAVSEVLGHTDLLIGEGRLREVDGKNGVSFAPTAGA